MSATREEKLTAELVSVLYFIDECEVKDPVVGSSVSFVREMSSPYSIVSLVTGQKWYLAEDRSYSSSLSCSP